MYALPHLVGMAKDVDQRQQDFQFHAPVPHLNLGPFHGGGAHQDRFRMDFLKIAADGAGLGNAGAVIQFQHGHLAQGILGQIICLPVFTFHPVHGDGGNFQALLGDKYPYPAGVWRGGQVIELHGSFSSLLVF